MKIVKICFAIVAFIATSASAFSLVKIPYRGVEVQVVFNTDADSDGMAHVMEKTKNFIASKCLKKDAVICEGVDKGELRKQVYEFAKKHGVGISGMYIKVPKDSNPKFYK